ncbi:MAG: Tyrocidine synthase 3 [Chroococcidiopsis sp. SAG 2025]|uniref:non-ribosomal peptide synthetase n=1 Tax=Chroococcidiopsis sp. SAG 2025 TaxID=171389 RepID=UPI0029373E66|nr:non-ribosomal peptide synthetase [Chroococcidiopsis sp. SAG 2025]MDV2992203.1 Tyrocidine synthase 3 [Chroococcidiopsis sp. SAG 2025]
MSDAIANIANLSPEQRDLLLQRLRQKRGNASSVKIQPQSRDTNTFPLSFAQQRLWFLDRLDPGNPLYNQAVALRIVGALNLPVLEQCFNEIVRRHEVLRTTFHQVDGQPVQVIAPSLILKLPVIDLEKLPAAEREVEVQRLATAEATRSFNLAEAPLLRFTILRLNQSEHILLSTIHHIISDGWSNGILIRELAALYTAFASGKPSPLPELSIQYADFAVWQRQWLQGEVLATQLAYWQQQLEGSAPILELPTDRPRPAIQTFKGAVQSFTLPLALTEALKDLSRREDVTLYVTLLAVFKTLLYRYTGQEDLLVGSPIANRNRSEIEGAIGFFANTLVMRTNMANTPSFRELLSRVRQVALGAYAHQDLPFEQLVEQLQPERSLSHTPLFQVMFALNVPMSALELPGLTLDLLETDSTTARFDLTLWMSQTDRGLTGSLEYNTDLFDRDTIARMLGHFQTLLAGVIENPDRSLGDLPLLTSAERQQILVEWNDSCTGGFPNPSLPTCLHHLFETQVEQTPDAIAVVFENEHLTYRELNQRANALAHYLQQLGVKPEVLVGICMERSLEMVVGLLGILKAGGAYVPLDPEYPSERLAFVLQDSQVAVLLTQEKQIAGLPNYQTHVICLDTEWEKISGEQKTNPLSDLRPENLAYVIYTSGSTGKPKGAMNTHRGICNRLLWMQQAYQLTSQDRVLQKTPFSFDVSVWEFFWTLIAGARLIIAKPGGHRDRDYLVDIIAQEQITTVHFVPSMLQVFLDRDLDRCDRLRRVFCSGEALSLGLQEKFFQHLDCELHNLYGPTEAAIDVTFWQCQKNSHLRTVPIGRPIANTQIYILDPRLQPVPIGVPGELYIGGVGVARGYLNRPELTQERFIPNPWEKSKVKSQKSKFLSPSAPSALFPNSPVRAGFEPRFIDVSRESFAKPAPTTPDSRLYKTGDLARYLPDGNIEFLGRIDHQVKIRGFRIELGEVEAVLSQHPEVKDTVVVAREDEPGDRRLVAYVVLHSQQAIASQLRGFLEKKLPQYAIPNHFVILEALPLLPNGKVNRQILPAPDPASAELKPDTAARTPVQQLLAAIWGDVLKLERVGIHDNFFQLGGHSLLATQVIARVRSAFEIELPLRYLFESPTIAKFSERVEIAMKLGRGREAPPIEPVSQQGYLPLSFGQQRLWLLSQLEPNNPFYNLPAAVRLTGLLDVAALEQSLDRIVQRHAALRTKFVTVDGQGFQVIDPVLNLSLPVVDLRSHPTREAQVQKLARQEANRPFNLDRDPLLRVMLLQVGDTEHVLLLTMHHIVSDAWSMGILVRELAALYQTFTTGESSPLPDLTIQYTDFAIWQRHLLQGEVLETQLNYWKQQLSGAPPLTQLPLDKPRSPVRTFRGAKQSFLLPKTLTAEIQNLCHREGVTLFMTLLAAFKTLLYSYTAQEDISVGSPIANRTQPEVEKLIGFFINTLVLRTDLSDDPSFRELLGRVRQRTLEAYTYQDVPFEKLLEELQPDRNSSYNPLFQVWFVLQNAPIPTPELSGLHLTPLEIDNQTTKYDLRLELEEGSAGLYGSFGYRVDLFEPNTITEMAERLEILLHQIVTQPDLKLSAIAQILANRDRERQIAKAKELEKASLQKFKKHQRHPMRGTQ